MKELIDYVEDPNKTGNQYVSTINCLKKIAYQQMIMTKKQYFKNDKYIAWHGYQSFKHGEITPDLAHEIGVKLAKEMWGDRFQIIVTTHLDKAFVHNHFVFNSVSFRDGGKYVYTKREQLRLSKVSNRLCREYGLSVIEHPHKAPPRSIWLDEKSGKPTRYNIYREDVTSAFSDSTSVQDAEEYLQRLGYITDFTGEHWKIRLQNHEHFTYLDTLKEQWTPDYLSNNLGRNAPYGSRKARMEFTPYMPYEYYYYYTPFYRTTHIYKLYLYYCYELGIFPKSEDYKPVSPYLREDLRRFDELTAQVDYMLFEHIQTLDDLYEDRAYLEDRLSDLTDQRKEMQKKIRRAKPEEKVSLRRENATLTKEITAVRKDLKCNRAIEERAMHIQDTLDIITANEERAAGREVPQQTADMEYYTTGKKKNRDYER